jgi:hypothetical protein
VKIALTVTLDVDPEVWASEYGLSRDDVRADVQAHLMNTVYEHYVNGLGIARDAAVRGAR